LLLVPVSGIKLSGMLQADNLPIRSENQNNAVGGLKHGGGVVIYRYPLPGKYTKRMQRDHFDTLIEQGTLPSLLSFLKAFIGR
jgi:hypothetical protein